MAWSECCSTGYSSAVLATAPFTATVPTGALHADPEREGRRAWAGWRLILIRGSPGGTFLNNSLVSFSIPAPSVSLPEAGESHVVCLKYPSPVLKQEGGIQSPLAAVPSWLWAFRAG